MNRFLSTSLFACTALAFCALPRAGAADFLIIVDSSGSMAESLPDGTSKMTAAKAALRDLKSDLSAHQLGVTLFGHRTDPKMLGSCQDVETVLPISDFIEAEYDRVVNSLKPRGNTPLAASLKQAATELMFRQKDTNKIVIVVTDGNETCGGDPISVAKQLSGLGINVKVHVIGFGIQAQEKAQLAALAKAGGGQFGLADTKQELEKLIRKQIAPQAELAQSEPAPVAKPQLTVIEKAIVAKLQDASRDVRKSAANTLTNMKATNAVPFLAERLMVDEDHYAWHAAASAVGSLDPEGCEQFIIDALSAKSAQIQVWAAKWTVHLKSGSQDQLSDIDAALVQALQSENRDVRTAAGKSLLDRKATAAVPQLFERIKVDGDYYAWHSAIGALNGLNQEKAVEALVGAMDAENSEIRKWSTDWISKVAVAN